MASFIWLFVSPSGKPSTRSVMSSSSEVGHEHRRGINHVVQKVAGDGEVVRLRGRVVSAKGDAGRLLNHRGRPHAEELQNCRGARRAMRGRASVKFACFATKLAHPFGCCESSKEPFWYPALSESPMTTSSRSQAWELVVPPVPVTLLYSPQPASPADAAATHRTAPTAVSVSSGSRVPKFFPGFPFFERSVRAVRCGVPAARE